MSRQPSTRTPNTPFPPPFALLCFVESRLPPTASCKGPRNVFSAPSPHSSAEPPGPLSRRRAHLPAPLTGIARDPAAAFAPGPPAGPQPLLWGAVGLQEQPARAAGGGQQLRRELPVSLAQGEFVAGTVTAVAARTGAEEETPAPQSRRQLAGPSAPPAQPRPAPRPG